MKHPTPLLPISAACLLASVAWAAGPAAQVNTTVRAVTRPLAHPAAAASATAQAAVTTVQPGDGVSSTVGGSENPASVVGAAVLATHPNPMAKVSASLAPAGVNQVRAGTTAGAVAVAPTAADLAAGTDSESIGMRRERLQREAEAAAHARLGDSGDTTLHADGSGGFSAAAAPTVDAIAQAEAARRDEIADRVDAQIDAGRSALAEANARARALAGTAKDRFDAARAEVSAREARLRQSARAARKATIDTWEDARARLAADDAAYVDAVNRAQVGATTGLEGSAAAAGAAAHGTAAVSAYLLPADTDDAADRIQSATFAARTQLAAEIDSGIDLGRDKVHVLRDRADDLGDQARTRFAAAAHLVEIRRRQLQTTLMAARRADADAWADARQRLAADFRSYAQALHDAEATAEVDFAATAGADHAVAAVSGSMTTGEDK